MVLIAFSKSLVEFKSMLLRSIPWTNLSLSKSLEDVEWIGLFTPFHYLNFDEKTNFISVAIFIAIIALSIISSFKLLEKKNINA